MKQAKQTATNY